MIFAALWAFAIYTGSLVVDDHRRGPHRGCSRPADLRAAHGLSKQRGAGRHAAGRGRVARGAPRGARQARGGQGRQLADQHVRPRAADGAGRSEGGARRCSRSSRAQDVPGRRCRTTSRCSRPSSTSGSGRTQDARKSRRDDQPRQPVAQGESPDRGGDRRRGVGAHRQAEGGARAGRLDRARRRRTASRSAPGARRQGVRAVRDEPARRGASRAGRARRRRRQLPRPLPRCRSSASTPSCRSSRAGCSSSNRARARWRRPSRSDSGTVQARSER